MLSEDTKHILYIQYSAYLVIENSVLYICDTVYITVFITMRYTLSHREIEVLRLLCDTYYVPIWCISRHWELLSLLQRYRWYSNQSISVYLYSTYLVIGNTRAQNYCPAPDIEYRVLNDEICMIYICSTSHREIEILRSLDYRVYILSLCSK